jgi:enoyl-CoA hydratase/carnithine racemase
MSNVHVRSHKDILWLILDKPPLNTLTAIILDKLNAAIHKTLQRPSRLVVITGTGERAFCAGVDMPDDDERHRQDLLRAARETETALDQLRKQHVPLVSLVKGSAFGAGCELAALCDVVIARDDAHFRLPAVNARVFPSAVSTHLPTLIGQEHTTRLMQSGETLTAQEAMRLGLAHQVLPAHHFLSDTEELLVMLATVGSPV